MIWDSRLDNLGVKAETTANAKWNVTAVIYQDDVEAQGQHHIIFTVLDAQNKPVANVTCVMDWLGRDPTDPPTKVVTDATGKANTPMYANLDPAKKNGPYFAYIEDPTKSDIVRGLGLPLKHHVNYLLTFAPLTAPPPPPPPGTLEQAIQTAAKQFRWMPINDTASLYQFALKNNLGYPQTDEFEVVFGGDAYIAQVYNLGIVYVKKGDWTNVKWVKKP